MQGDKRMNLPPPPGCRFTYTDLLSLSGSEESYADREITFTKDLKFSKFSDFENDPLLSPFTFSFSNFSTHLLIHLND